MAVIKVHGNRDSLATVLVLCCLNEKELQYELVQVDLGPVAAQNKPQYLALNPFGQVPTIQDGDLTLFESRAIIKYLANKYKGQGTDLLGNNLSEQALVEQWCEVEGQSFYPLASSIVYETFVMPMSGGGSIDVAAEEKLNKVLDIYEERLSKSKYLAGDFFSLADLQHLPWTHYLMDACRKDRLITSRKHVNSWWKDISSRRAWKMVEIPL